MEITQMAALALIGVCLIVTIKNHRPEIALLLSVLCGVIILAGCIPQIKSVIDGIKNIYNMSGIEPEYMGLLLKVIGIVYITEFSSGICKDANEESIALKVQLAGKVTILGIAIPLMVDILNIISGILK